MTKQSLKKIIFASLCLVSQITHANESSFEFRPSPCDPEYNYGIIEECPPSKKFFFNFGNWLCDWELSGEAVFFKPAIEQLSYVISSVNNFVGEEQFPSGKRHNNSANFKPGYRLEALHKLCDCRTAVDFRFSYFKNSFRDSKSGFFLYDTNGYPGDGAQAPEDVYYKGEARVRDKFRYFAVDGTFNRYCMDSCLENFTFFFGLHYANIEHDRQSRSLGTFPNPTTQVNNLAITKSKFWGIGPQIGIDYRYNLLASDCCCDTIAIFGNARASLLCSKSNAQLHYSSLRTSGSLGVNLKNEDLWRVTPALDFRLGFSYQFTCFCLDPSLEVGYEWIWYQDSVDTITGLDVAFAGDTIDVFSNFSLQGPFIKLTVSF